MSGHVCALAAVVAEHQAFFVERWNEHFGPRL
jgi:hypothetical protein